MATVTEPNGVVDPAQEQDPVAPVVTPEGDNNDSTNDEGKTFTQEDITRIVGERLAKEKKEHEEAISELNNLRKKSEMTAKDKFAWETKYNELFEKNLTSEELKERELAKAKKEKEELVSSLTSDRDGWKAQFESAMVSNEIKDASIELDAFSAQQIENNLRDYIRVESISDDNGKLTGQHKVVIDFPDKDSDGNAIVMKLSTLDTVTRMKEIPYYQNLFRGGSGGLGANNEDSTESGSPEFYAAQGPEAYNKAFKEGRINYDNM